MDGIHHDARYDDYDCNSRSKADISSILHRSPQSNKKLKLVSLTWNVDSLNR